ncbi:hypothetical protein LCGC14_1617740, partial [marine sediment metagenome]
MKNFTKYESRFKAGKILAEFLRRKNKILYNTIFENPKIFFSYAIPNGGIPVAEGFCSTLNINYDIIIVRKIKIPYNTEAGFGSLTSNGTIFINKLLLNRLNLTNKAIILSDLRAEIGPHKMLDLEKVAERTAVDRSYDLRLALSTKRLRLCSQGVVSKTSKPEVFVVEKIIEKHHHHESGQQGLDEARLAALMKKIMLENQV